jgi:hypothetical protein
MASTAPLRRIAAATLFITAGTLSATITLAPAAYAQSEQEIQHNCDQANGDYYSTGVAEDGHTYSVCCYHDTITHQNMCMSFMDGQYTETDPAPNKAGPPSPGPRPVRPPVNNAPITTAPPQAR